MQIMQRYAEHYAYRKFGWSRAETETVKPPAENYVGPPPPSTTVKAPAQPEPATHTQPPASQPDRPATRGWGYPGSTLGVRIVPGTPPDQ